ncbi:MAG: PKD domain-containing protein [Bacteroidetes bacterium]|nr:PKD domain-containing protein [Bacteroidota bacterium]
MKEILKYITILIIILFSITGIAQTDTEFWFVVPEIQQQHNDRPIRFVFTTTDFAADITLEMPANPAFTPVNISLPANTTDWIEYSDAADLNIFENKTIMDQIGSGPAGTSISNKGIRITSTAPITCYYEVNTTNNSDIWSLKGSNGLGTDFYIPFQDIGQNRHKDYAERGWSSIEIIGTGGTTVVEIYPSKEVYRDATHTNETNPYTVTLEKGEVYTIAPGWDPTAQHGYLNPPTNTIPWLGWFGVFRDQHIGGTYIHVQSGDPVAVVVKDDSVTEDIGESTSSPNGGWDIIADQWVPLHILGTEYVAMRGTLISDNEFLFAVATENNTRIWWEYGGIDTTVIPVNAVIDKGEQVRIPFPNTQAYKYVISNNKLSVLHVSGVGTEMGGAVLPPIDKCTGSTNVGFTRSKGDPAKFHMNIMVRKTAKDGFLVNGAAPAFFGSGNFTDIPGTEWSVARIQNITDANVPPDVTTTISNTKDVFHLGVINETDGGAGCRFGYFSDFNEVQVSALSLQDDAQPTATPRVCIGDSIQLYSSKAISYEWWPSDDLSSTTIFNPKALVTGYKVYYVKVSGYCNQSDTASVTITPLTQPDANFMLSSPSGCAPLDINIRNVSKNVSRMYWDFNNTLIDGTYDQDTTIFKKISGNDSTVLELDTTFFHQFNNTSFEPIDSPQMYQVKLIVKNTKCYDSLSTFITVYPEVTADFTLSDLDDTLSCNPAVVDFEATALSINEDYYKWSFGDGALSSTGDTTHEYVNVDPENDVLYTAQLITRSQWNCRDTAYQDFLVHPYLEGGFTIDKDEGCSPLNVKIDNISTGADSIFLDYGDGTLDTLLSFNTVYHMYRNNDGVDEVDTNIIVMRVKNDEGCEFIDRDTILVYPEFEATYTIDGPGDYEGCNSRTVTFDNTTNNGTHLASRYLWEFADGTSMDTTNNTIQKFYNNTTSANREYDFRLTARSQYGCKDDTTNTITIYRAFANFTVDNNEGCSPLDVRVTNISIGDQIDTWNWDYGDGIGTSVIEQPLGQYTYHNNGIENDTNYLVLEVSEPVGGCTTTDTAMIVVYPEVQVSYVENHINVPSCDSLVVEFNSTLSNPALDVDYEWDFGDGGSSSAADTVHVYKNLLLSTPQNRQVKLRAETEMGCFDEFSTNITVNPRVKARIFIDKTSGCSPLTVDVNAQTYPGISNYSWDYGDGSGTSSMQNPTPYSSYPANQSYAPEPGGDDNYELILEVDGSGGACTDSDTVDVTIYSEVVADFTPDVLGGCNPLTVNFTDNSSANTEFWNWDFDDGSTSSTQNTQNTFVNTESFTYPFDVTLDVISDRGCTNSTVQQINVLPYVEADFDINISEGCSPLTVTITNNSLSSGTEWYWYWDKDDRVINAGVLAAANSNDNTNSFTHTFVNNSGSSRTDSLTLIVGNGNGCYEIYKRAITVHSTIDAEFDVSVDEGCNPLSVQFTNNTVNGSIYNWNFGDGSSTTTASPNKVFTNTTTTDKPFTVRLTAESAEGCVDTEDTVITVYSKVISGFSIATSEGCPPFTTTIENTSVGNASNTYQWLIDNVAVAGAPTDKSDFDHTYENTVSTVRDYQVKLIATNPHGCTSEHIDIVRVYEYVEASFSMDVNEGCTPLVVDFIDLSTVPVADTKYTWEFRDGATSGLSDPDHTFYNPSRTTDIQREVKLTVQSANYCSDDTSLTVDIYHQPLAKFYIDKTSSCPPLQSTLTKLSEGEDSYEWRFGDGNTSTTDENFVYTWDNTDIDNIQYYNLELWVGTNNNCVDSTSLDVTVFPKVIADFTMSDTAGCSPLKDVQFTNTSTSPATQFFWTFGDGSYTNIENPLHDFANITSVDRVYDIYLRASSEYNCFDDTTQHITVYRQPEAEFYIDPNYMTFPENTVGITNVTNPGPFDYFWEFGDINNSTSTVKDPNQFEYEHWGQKIIELTVTSQTNSDCFDYFSDTAIILPPKVNADFTTDKNGGCVDGGLEVQFTAAGSAYNEEYQYDWEFGDGETGEGQYVTHVYEEPGAYYVKLTARSREYTDVEEDYAYKTIYAYANPEVNFEVSPKLAMLDPTTLEARVKFYNMSTCNDTSGCAYTWDFGDGETAISTDVTHGYKELGKFDVSLTAVSVHGCRDSLTLYEEVEIIGAGQIAFPNAFTPDGFGPPENETFKPLAEGVIEYELFIYNRWGELIFTTKDLSKGWDGTIDGEPAKPDVYVWKAQGKYTNGKSFELAGDVTLIR